MEVQSGGLVHPYTNIKCQTVLFQLLLAFFEQPLPAAYPPISLCLTLFTKGSYSQYVSVSQICNEALNVLEKLAQPICPTMYIGCLDNSKANQKTIEPGTTEINVKIEDDEPVRTANDMSSEATIDMQPQSEATLFKPCSVVLSPLNAEKSNEIVNGNSIRETINLLKIEVSSPSAKRMKTFNDVSSVTSNMSEAETDMICDFDDSPQ